MNKIKVLFLAFTLSSTQLFCQSNWITNNFKEYLNNGNYSSYINQARNELRNLRGSEEKQAFQVVELFKTLSGFSNIFMPICYLNIANNAVQISPTTIKLKPDLYLYTYYISGQYYFCLYNSDRYKMRLVKLSGTNRSSNSYNKLELSGGVDNYSFKCIGRSDKNFNFSVTEFSEYESFTTSPCF